MHVSAHIQKREEKERMRECVFEREREREREREKHSQQRRRNYGTAYEVLMCLTVSKETYYSVKRDLLQCQKRPTTALLMRFLCLVRRFLCLVSNEVLMSCV